jgi:hypothetical protein
MSKLLSAVAVLAILFTVAAALAVKENPFRRDQIVRQIETRSGARITIGPFRQTWFPPGFHAQQIRITAAGGDLLTIDSAECEASYTGLLRRPKAVKTLHIRGLRLVLSADWPGGVSALFKGDGSGSALAIDEIRIDDSNLRLASATPADPSVEFLIHSLRLRNFGRGNPVQFAVALGNPKPAGEIHARGEFGPVNKSDPGRTPVSGDFTFEQADLTLPRAVSGFLNAQGSFRGPLIRLECTGTADVPRFQVMGSSHTVHIAARFEATVDGTTGDTDLKRITAHYNDTTVFASGKAAGMPGQRGKTIDLSTRVDNGRVEDLLILFTSHPVPAMQGPITFQAKFLIPPGPPGFLTRLNIDGRFDIKQAHFTDPKTQTPVNRLSASAEGEPRQQQREHPTLAPADIHGDVVDRNGIARLSHVVFQVPGIRGTLEGTFTLNHRQIALRGTLQTNGKLADTTNGVKALMLKAIGPFWLKKGSVRSIPFAVTGSSSRPVFRLKLRK